MNNHLVLLGDSIFDNALYVPNGLSVLKHVRNLVAESCDVTMSALDGATVSSVFRQIERIPTTATHLALSVGGNDALRLAATVFMETTSNVGSSFQRVSEEMATFRSEYKRLVSELLDLQLPLATCTIYDCVPVLQSSEKGGLGLFNDTITRTAFELGSTLIDLRTICNEKSDYSEVSPIEPSDKGGLKIATAIVTALFGEGEAKKRSVIA